MVKRIDEPSVSTLAQALVDHLEILKLYGWPPPLQSAACKPTAPKTSPGPAEPPTRASIAAAPVKGAPAMAAPAPTSGTERADRDRQLAELSRQVASCTRCALAAGRTQTVFGVGSSVARILVVGEGPGYEEDRRGEPFVGAAGQLLDKILRAMGLRREEVYIANVVKCRPPGNRNPAPSEAGECLPYLERQVEIIAPEVILALGGVAAKALLNVDEPMWRLRERVHNYRGIPLMATYHPAYLLRNPQDKRKVWQDVQGLMTRLGLPPPSS